MLSSFVRNKLGYRNGIEEIFMEQKSKNCLCLAAGKKMNPCIQGRSIISMIP